MKLKILALILLAIPLFGQTARIRDSTVLLQKISPARPSNGAIVIDGNVRIPRLSYYPDTTRMPLGPMRDSILIAMSGSSTTMSNLGAISVKDSSYGAIGNGIANDSLAFAQTFTAALATGKKIIVPSGRYRIPYGIDIPSGITMEGAGSGEALIFTDVAGYDLLRINGTITDTIATAKATALQSQRKITVVSTSGFTAGDTVYIKSNAHGDQDGAVVLGVTASGTKAIFRVPNHKLYTGENIFYTGITGISNLAGGGFIGVTVDSILTDSTFRINRTVNGTYVSGGLVYSGTGDDQEMNVVESVVGDTLTMKYRLYDTYRFDAVGNRKATITKINPKINVTLKNISVKTTGLTGGGGEMGRSVRFQYVWGAKVENVTSYVNLRFSIYDSRDVHISRSKFDSSFVTIERSKFCSITHSYFKNIDNAVGVWKNSDDNLISDNQTFNLELGFCFAAGWSERNSIINNKIFYGDFPTSYYGIVLDYGSNYSIVNGNTITGPYNGATIVGISGTGSEGIQTSHNTITNCAFGIELEACQFGQANDNIISYKGPIGNGNSGIFADNASGSDTLQGMSIRDNTIIGPGMLYAIAIGSQVDDTVRARNHGFNVSDNIIYNVPRGIIYSNNVDYSIFKNNIAYGDGTDGNAYGLTSIANNNGSLKHNQVSGNTESPHPSQYHPYTGTIASADSIELEPWDNFYIITGSTPITYIESGHRNNIIVLKFNNECMVNNGRNLVLNDNFLAAENSTITLISDGTNWIELSRSVAPAAISDLPYTYQQSSKIRTAVALTTVTEGDGVQKGWNDDSPTLVTNFSAGTIETWLYIKSLPATGKIFFGRRGIGAQDTNASKFVVLPDGKILGSHRGWNGVTPIDTGVISTTTLNVEQWYHVAWSWDGTDQRIFINGVLDATKASTDTGTSVAEQSSRGTLLGGGIVYANVKLAEFRIWKKARTTGEILADYNLHLTGAEADLQAYLRFDDTTHTSTLLEVRDQKTGLNSIYQYTSNPDSVPLIYRTTVGRFEGEITLDYVSSNATVDTMTVNNSINFDGGGSAGDVLTRDADGNALWQNIDLPTLEGYQALLDSVNDHKDQNTQQSDSLWVHRTDIDSLFVVVGDLIDSLAIFLALMDEQELSKQAYADTNTWDATRDWVLSQGFGSGGGDIEGVTAGNGLQGGGTTGTVTLNATPKALGGLIVTDDSLEVDSTKYFSTYAGSLKAPRASPTLTGSGWIDGRFGIGVDPIASSYSAKVTIQDSSYGVKLLSFYAPGSGGSWYNYINAGGGLQFSAGVGGDILGLSGAYPNFLVKLAPDGGKVTVNGAAADSNLNVTGGGKFSGGLLTSNVKITNGAGANKVLTSDPDGDATWETAAGGGDMVLASVQTITGAKTFNDTKFFLQNVANTFNASFVNTNTADRIYTLQNAAGTLAFLSDITGTNSGTNTGDNAVNSLYSGLVSNATHTGDATGATALTVVGINSTLMSGLATGILKNTTTTGVPSIAVAGDFPTLNQNTTGTAATFTGALTGDVTSSAMATTIAADAVTLAQMADMATASLIYRKTAATGNPEVNSLATLKTDLGLTGTNSGDQTITLTGDVTGSGVGSFAATIAAGVIVNADVNTSAAIDATKLADGTVTSTELQYINTLSSNAQTQIDGKQPLEATLTDIADGTIAENLVNTANPWAVNEGGTGAATLTDGGILLGTGTSAVHALGVATNGQIPIGDGTTDPVLGTVTGTAGEVTVTNGAGTITLSVPDVYPQMEMQAGMFDPKAGDLTGATALADDADNTNDFTLDQLEFSASAENYISATINMPPDWDATTAPKFKIIYYSGTGHASNTVEWDIATGYIRPGTDSWVAALGTAVTTNHIPTTANIWYITSALAPTPAGTAAAGAQLKIRIFRDGDDAGNDTHTATARLVKVIMQYKKTVYGDVNSW